MAKDRGLKLPKGSVIKEFSLNQLIEREPIPGTRGEDIILTEGGVNLPKGSVLKEYDLKRFSNEIPVPGAPKYKFTLFDKEGEQVKLTLAEAAAEAEKMLTDANEEADRLEAEAGALKAEAEANREAAAQTLKEAEEIKAKAYDEGHEEGYAAGHEKGDAAGRIAGHKQYLSDCAPLIQAMTKVEDLYQELWEVNEPSMVSLATKIGELIALKDISSNVDAIAAAYKAALDRLHEQQAVVFRLHPEDLEYLEIARHDLETNVPALTKISFESDPDLSRGDLIMDTESGRMDATVKRRIANVVPQIEAVIEDRFEMDW